MSDFLKAIGLLGWAAGAWLLFSGFGMGVTVDVGQGPVANLELMHVQQMNLLIGALAVIDGSICLIGGLILDRLPDRAKPDD